MPRELPAKSNVQTLTTEEHAPCTCAQNSAEVSTLNVPESTTEWLVMLFLGGDDSIFQFGGSVLREAARIGSTAQVVVVAERDSPRPYSLTKRGKLERDQPDLREIVGVTSPDPQTIIDFIEDAKPKHPSKNRLLVLWDHGNGWQNVHAFEPVVQATQIVRERESLVLPSLAEALGNRGINVVGFDSCLMAMIEIAYELRDKVEFMVASENVVPADSGWPHDSILNTLTLNYEMTPESLACAMVDAFTVSYNRVTDPSKEPIIEPVTLFAIRLGSVIEE
ncbi:MAG TPA: clostripain-related cysteine peptidase, partial [Thermoanaerobaculia bacterium]|nr:clostripain-related cysteine peptidase [Thermoanaerobaculia bacterium]